MAMRLGKYELVRRINAGGMAELFLARSAALQGFEKIVVIKRILPQFSESNDFVQMFLSEARLAGTLHHPNIVQVYDIGEQDGEFFFAMEWIQGHDVREIVRSARRAQIPLPREMMLHIILGLAAGLHHAHDQKDAQGRALGIVHRDVSPANILVTYEGDVKVVDFGIAKAAALGPGTVAGGLKGKIPYMSPEQCRGELVDRRSDVFSIGTMMWELTLGRRLFKGENEFAQLAAVQSGDIPKPTALDPDYPTALEAIVMKALERDKDKRYQTAKELRIAIEDFVREERLAVSATRMSEFMDRLFPPEDRTEPITLSGPETFPESATDTSQVPSVNITSAPAPATSRRLAIAGLVGGVIAISALAGLAWYGNPFTAGQTKDPTPGMPAAAATVAKPADEPGQESATPEGEPDEPGEPDSAEGAVGDPSSPHEADEADEVDEVDEVDEDGAVDGESADGGSGGEDATQVDNTDATAEPDEAKRSSRRRKTPTRRRPKPTKKPPSEPKPTPKPKPKAQPKDEPKPESKSESLTDIEDRRRSRRSRASDIFLPAGNNK